MVHLLLSAALVGGREQPRGGGLFLLPLLTLLLFSFLAGKVINSRPINYIPFHYIQVMEATAKYTILFWWKVVGGQ